MYRHSDHMNPRNKHTEDKTNDSICATEFITVSPDKFAVSLNRKALLECLYSIGSLSGYSSVFVKHCADYNHHPTHSDWM